MYIKGILSILVLLAIFVSSFSNLSNQKISHQYNIYLDGKWSDEDKEEILLAVQYVGIALGTKIHRTPWEAFNLIYERIIIREAPSEVGYYGRACSNNVLLLKPGKVTHRLIIHELGHLFDYILKRAQGGIYSDIDHPIEFLRNNGIYNSSQEFVTGTIYGSYNRNSGKFAPKNGYFSDNYRDGWQWHPQNMGGGNSASEDWADMFLNWSTNSFVDNKNGKALYSWVDNNISRWGNIIIKGNLTYLKRSGIILRRIIRILLFK